MTRRLLLSYLSLTVVVLAMLEVPLGVQNARSERADLTAKVERDAVAVASLAEATIEGDRNGNLPALRTLATHYAADTGGRVVIVDRKGDAVVDSAPPAPGTRNFATRPEFEAALRGDVASGTRHSQTLGTDFLYVAVPIASGGVVHGAARVSYPTSTVDERVRRYWLVLGLIAVFVLAVAAIIGWSFARWIRQPLEGVEQAAAAAGGGDLDARAPVPDGPPELRTLALEFNDMIAKLDGVVAAQRDFVADASHELRTPLTALRLRLENLEHAVTEEGRDGLVAATTEVERLSGLVDSLLSLARVDAGTAPSGTVDAVAVVRARTEAWSALAEERGVSLELDAVGPRFVHAGADRVAQVVDNLVSNALEASPRGSTVTVAVGAAGAMVEVSVRDRGPGLTDAQKTRAFDRFWRAGTGGGGSGLGLAIAQRLVKADDGDIVLRDVPGGGLEAIVRLPPAVV